MLRPLHILVNLLAITVITFLGVDIFYRMVRIQLWPEEARQMPAARRQIGEQAGRRTAAGYETLLKRNLFGVSGRPEKEPAASAQAEIKNLEPTTLQVRLLGTIAGDEGSGRAVIEDLKLKVQNLYRVGDEIQGARVKKILRGKVVLGTGAKDEILVMEEKPSDAKSGAGVRPAANASRLTAARTKARPAAAAKPEPAAAQEAGAAVALDREEIQTAFDNIGEILSQVRVQPIQEEGNTTGLQVSEISPDSIFARMGLKDGDVVEAVNGKQIESPDDIVTIYQNLKAGSRLKLRVSRGGQQEVLNYNIR